MTFQCNDMGTAILTNAVVNSRPVLLTRRLRLRRWLEKDLAPYVVLNRDPEVMAYYPTTLDAFRALACVEQSEKNFDAFGYSFWAVELRDTCEFVGSVGLDPCLLPGALMPVVAMSWQLASKFWGKGYAQEASVAVLEYAFKTLRMKEIIAILPEVNLRSLRLAERLGFTRDPLRMVEEPAWPLGHPCRQQALYRMTPADKAEK